MCTGQTYDDYPHQVSQELNTGSAGSWASSPTSLRFSLWNSLPVKTIKLYFEFMTNEHYIPFKNSKIVISSFSKEVKKIGSSHNLHIVYIMQRDKCSNLINSWGMIVLQYFRLYLITLVDMTSQWYQTPAYYYYSSCHPFIQDADHLFCLIPRYTRIFNGKKWK